MKALLHVLVHGRAEGLMTWSGEQDGERGEEGDEEEEEKWLREQRQREEEEEKRRKHSLGLYRGTKKTIGRMQSF